MLLIPLQYFKCVAEHGNISGAAEELHVSPQTLSAAIITLERDLGHELFDRTKGKSNTLNEYGRLFLAYAKEALEGYERVEQEMEAISRRDSCIVSLASTGLTFPNETIAAFKKANPEYTIQQHIIPQNRIDSYAARSDIDLIFSAVEYSHPDWEAATLWQEHMYLVVFAVHPLAGRASVQLQEAAGERFALMPSQYYWSETVKNLCEKAGFTPNIEVECFPDQYASLLKQGYVTILSEGSRRTLQLDPLLFRFIPLSDDFCVRNIRLMRKKDRALPAAAKAFWQFAIQQSEDR